jgi:predicted metal-dependent peptidase
MNEDHIKYKKMIEDTDKRVKGLIAKWVLRYDYFGFLFSLVRRKAEVGLKSPACISPTSAGTLELLYNPILLSSTSDEDLNEILHHEGLHILNKHISRLMRILADIPFDEWKEHKKLINTACDCCVNFQGKIKSPLMIAGVPFHLQFPQNHNLEPDRMMEEYYYTLLDRQRKEECGEKTKPGKGNDGKGNKQSGKEQDDGDPDDGDPDDSNDDASINSPQDNGDEDDKESGKGKGCGKSDDSEDGKSTGQGTSNADPLQMTDESDLGNHVLWSSENITDPHSLSRNIDTYTQRIIRDSAMNFGRSKNRGNLPGYIQDLIEEALKPPAIPYYELVRQLVRGSKLGKYKRSLTHINRKRTYVFQLEDHNIPMISPFPGRKRDDSFIIGIIIDTSGSQGPEDILEGLSGCKNIIEKDPHCETTVLEVDTIIHKEYKLKKVSDINFDVKGRGGTKLIQGIERCRELKVDVCICFTDGYTEDFNEIDRRKFPKRMIWVITPKGTDVKLDKVGFTVFLPERKEIL